jgi:hypothetical protein
MKVRSTLSAIALAAVMSITAACDFPQSCEGLDISDQDREAASNGYEVEKEDSLGNECQLSSEGTSWSVDD